MSKSARSLPDAEKPKQVEANVPEPPDPRPLWQRLAADRWGETALARPAGVVVLAVAVLLGAFQLYTALFLSLNSYHQRVVHLMFVLVLVFMLKPAAKRRWARRLPMAIADLVLVAVAVAVSLYPVVEYDSILLRIGDPSDLDVAMGTVMVLLLLEACRRTIGLFMSVLVAVFLAYAWIGPLLPDFLAHRGYTFQRISYHSFLFQEGIYGLALGVAATFVFMFIFFGALLEKTGGGNFFIDLANCLTGKYRGGPAKGAVVGSAFMGSISGSAIANTVTTGAFTIPMMKRVGYKAHDAGGVEAAASTGGQLLPPIMGAGAFVMAEMIGVPYAEIALVAIIPALMYFAVVFLFVDILARKQGIGGIPAGSLPRARTILAQGFHFLAPFALLVYLLFQYVAPIKAGLWAVVALFVVAMLRRSSRLSLRDLAEVFVLAARNTLTVSVATAAAGIVVGMVGLTGLGLRFSGMMVDFAGENLLLMLLMIALASLVLGLGLPVTASYVVLAVLAGPALLDLGLPIIVAHMIIYWLSQDSNVTPPVALAGFTAAGIAGASPMRTSFSAWKFAKGLYLIPLLMAYSPLLLNGSPAEVALAVVTGMGGLFAFAVALEGYWLTRTTLVERVAMVAAMALIVAPRFVFDAIGLALVLAVAGVQLWRHRTAEPAHR
ncbi:TRAP transporter permease [Glycomyces sp. YM15]|uniref:TRAP transporter permease n=1 Tax=Glycomyces sp. YM15 TaxID=2800446 RepID=UPI0019650D11|nr:TRAP transporter permease [Glycomyces sp. YM15]